MSGLSMTYMVSWCLEEDAGYETGTALETGPIPASQPVGVET